MGIEIRYQKVNGVSVPYWVPVFCEDGADGLEGADQRILELQYMKQEGIVVPYWVADTCGDKYTDDFPGEVQPPMPTGFTGNWNTYELVNFDRVGSKVNEWYDLSGAMNTLTQSTDLDRPTLSISGGSVTQAVPGEQPTLTDIGGGELVASFSTTDSLVGISGLDGDNWAFELIFDTSTTTQILLYDLLDGSTAIGRGGIGNIGFNWENFGEGDLVIGTPDNTKLELLVVNNNSIVTGYLSGVEQETLDLTGETLFNPTQIGRDTLSLGSNMYSYKQWATSDTNLDPVFTLLPTLSSIPTGEGAGIAEWFIQESNPYLNRVNKTATQFMSGYPEIVGDVSHVGAITYTSLGTLKKDYSHSTGLAWLGANTDDFYEAVSDSGKSFVFESYRVTLDHSQTVWIIRGTELELWVFGNLVESQDFTGETLTLDQFGAPADSAVGASEFLPVYPFALAVEDIPWFSYIRNEDTNLVLLPATWPAPAQILFESESQGFEEFTLVTDAPSEIKVDWGDGTVNSENTHTYTDLEPTHDITLVEIVEPVVITEIDIEGTNIRRIHLNVTPDVTVINAKDSKLRYGSIRKTFIKLARYGTLNGTFDYSGAFGEAKMDEADQTFVDAYNTVVANGWTITGVAPTVAPAVVAVDSLTLPASTDYITGTKSSALELEQDQSWSMRVKPSDITGVNQLFTLNYNAPSARGTNLRFYLGNLEFVGYTSVGVNSFTIRTSTETFAINNWVHIVITTDAVTFVNIYVNGVKEVFGGIGSSSGNDPLLDLAIGTMTGGGVGGNKINRVQVWDRAISDAEVLEDYNGSTTEYVSYDKQVLESSTLITGKIFDSDLEDASLVEHTGNSTLTAIGAPTYTNQGMTKTV